MLTTIIQRTGISLAAITTACFGLSGVAAAQTGTITNTGPGSTNSITSNRNNSCTVHTNNNVSATNNNNQIAVSGSVSASGNTNVSGSTWDSWNPAVWQGSFTDWQNGLMQWMTMHGPNTWNTTGTNVSWRPGESTAWQNTWSNWDPSVWQANGQTHTNWQNLFMNFFAANTPQWMQHWTGGSGGGVNSGDANNSSSANFSVNVTTDNSGTCQSASTGGEQGGSPSVNIVTPPAGGRGTGVAAPTEGVSSGQGGGFSEGTGGFGGFSGGSGGEFSPSFATEQSTQLPSGGRGESILPPIGPEASDGASISNTGPGSTNSITDTATSNTWVTTTNTISVNNSSTQTATSGNASATNNTWTGGSGSGDAGNAANTGMQVGVGNQ